MQNKETILNLLAEVEQALIKGDMLKAQISLQQAKSLIKYGE